MKIRTVITCLLLSVFTLWFHAATAQETQSDYNTVQNFNEKYESLRASLDTAETVPGSEILVEKVNKLKDSYQQQSDLLDKAFYPETFSGRMNKLVSQAKSTLNKLRTIAEQRKKLKKLTGRVGNVEERYKKIQNKADSLAERLQEESRQSDRLARTVRSYRESVKSLDQLILSFMDSLMINYRSLNTQQLQDLRSAFEQAGKDIDNNPLQFVRSIAQANIDYLNSTTKLTPGDYLRMYSVQQKFQKMWNIIGNKLITIYAKDKNRDRIQNEINNAISEWRTKVADKTWNSLNQAFTENNIGISEFGDTESFYNNLSSYVDSKVKASKEGADQARKQFEEFQAFWSNTVKGEWAEHLVSSEILNYSQISSIDQKLYNWQKESQPTSYIWKILLGIAVLLVIVLAILLARKGSGEERTRTAG